MLRCYEYFRTIYPFYSGIASVTPGANSLLSMTTGSEKPGKSASNVRPGVFAMNFL